MSERKVREIYNENSSTFAYYKHAGIYCRMGLGPGEQAVDFASDVSELVQLVFHTHDMKLADIYLDRVRGNNAEPSQFKRMLSDVESGKIDVLCVKNLSRFGTSIDEAVNALKIMKEKRVGMIIAEIGGSILDPVSDVVISALSKGNAARCADDKPESVRKRFADPSARVCYGYSKDADGFIVVNPDEVAVVQLIFDSYIGGMSIVGIQILLKTDGIFTSRGNPEWSKMAIEKILLNEKYAGTDAFPALISDEEFYRAKLERERRANSRRIEP